MRLDATRKTDLAVRAMIALELGGSRLKSGELAAELSATKAFMAHVMAPLVKHGWVRSDPGPSGGYALLVELDDVSMLALVEAVEGPIEDQRCVVANRPCADVGVCALHHAWAKARTMLADELQATSIADVAHADLNPSINRNRRLQDHE